MMAAAGAFAAVAACAALIVVSWSVIGPAHSVFVVVVVCAVFSAAAFTGPLADRWVSLTWINTSDRGARVLRSIGVSVFGDFLRLIRWRVRGRLESPSGIEQLAAEVKRSFGGHLFGAAAHAVVAVLVLAAGRPWAACWLVLSAVPLHIYPALLQVMVYRRVVGLQELIAGR